MSATDAVIIVDVWNTHRYPPSRIRCEKLIPKMDQFVRKARDSGALIVHAPGHAVDFYTKTRAYRRTFHVPRVRGRFRALILLTLDTVEPPLPYPTQQVTQELVPLYRQHPGIWIDHKRDIITINAKWMYDNFCFRGINHLYFIGKSLNGCVLGRPFGVINFIKVFNMECTIVRDLTDNIPTSEETYEEDFQSVINYIEENWCPTVLSNGVFNGSL